MRKHQLLKKKTFDYMFTRLLDNGGKFLNHTRHPWFVINQRDRAHNQRYYTTIISANHIKTMETRFLINGEGVNIFTSMFVNTLMSGQAPTVMPIKERKMIVYTSINEPFLHIALFKHNTPNLAWGDSNEY